MPRVNVQSDIKKDLKKTFRGEIETNHEKLIAYETDASLFQVCPEAVLFPKDAKDVATAVSYVAKHKKKKPLLSITARAAGTDMTGGPLNESLILDTTKYLSKLSIDGKIATILPGTYYRDLEGEALRKNLVLPCYPASKGICAIGGMIGNNCGGEKTLQYGQMRDYVRELSAVMADGKEYVFKPLNKEDLAQKIKQKNFEGKLYAKLKKLLEKNEGLINSSYPQVSKNSSGYLLNGVWDGNRFDMTKLLVGSQGTLGIVTEAKLQLVPVKTKERLVVIFLKDLKPLAELVNVILPWKPESFESYDRYTLKLAMRFFPELLRSMKGVNLFKLMFSFIPEAFMMLRGGVPELVLLAECAGNTDEEVDRQARGIANAARKFSNRVRIAEGKDEIGKYWAIRRESFNLLRKHVRGLRTAPFIDDVVVPPAVLPEYLPKLQVLLNEYHLTYTIAGHVGNGNFHIIPLMDLKKDESIETIFSLGKKVNALTRHYGGSISAEHNDGIIRTPYLEDMYGKEMMALFFEVKNIFDPANIFNPGKKVGGTEAYARAHIAREPALLDKEHLHGPWC